MSCFSTYNIHAFVCSAIKRKWLRTNWWPRIPIKKFNIDFNLKMKRRKIVVTWGISNTFRYFWNIIVKFAIIYNWRFNADLQILIFVFRNRSDPTRWKASWQRYSNCGHIPRKTNPLVSPSNSPSERTSQIQFCRKASRPERELNEKTTRRHNDKNGSARKRIYEK